MGRNVRATLAPLHQARGPWLATELGKWREGADLYALEQFLFVGPRGGGD
jgi:hypothetical protein